MSSLSTDPTNRQIGRRLAAVRAKEGLIQNEFAERLGISGRAYINYERGEREIPAVLLITLLQEFGVDPQWILVGPGDEPVLSGDRPKPKLLIEIERTVAQWLKSHRKRLTEDKQNRLVELLYERTLVTGHIEMDYLEKIGSIAA